MGLLKEAFPTWKDKATLFFAVVAIALLLVLWVNVPERETTSFNEQESGNIVTKWEDEFSTCYIILDKETKQAHSLSCLPKAKE